MTDDSSRNPEADTFHYIQLIVEALNKMNRLDIAIDTIEQRLPVELFKVVEKSNNEVAQRHPSTLRAYANKARGKADVIIEGDTARTTLLNDLLWTLYARFEAIAEGHRVVHDVVSGISRREELHDAAALTRGFKELWKLYQSEVCLPPRERTHCFTHTLTRCGLSCMTISRLMEILHIEMVKASPLVAACSRRIRETAQKYVHHADVCKQRH
jgi:hypothetical protein